MSLQAKPDYFGLSSGGSLVVTQSNENKSSGLAVGHNDKGDIVAYEPFGEKISPNCTYVLKADYTLGSLVCGQPITYDNKKLVYGSVTINTAAGSPPTIDITGEEVPSDFTHSDCKYNIPAATLKMCHHAQILWDAFSISGDGNYLQSANYTAGGELSTATKDGDIVAYDVTDGKLEVQITIQQTGNTSPTVTPGSNWHWQSPLTCSNPDSDYPSWTGTLAQFLTHATTSTPAQAGS